MPDKTLKGSGISKKSLESADGVEFAARLQAYYDCELKHVTVLPFSTDAGIPPAWECRCGRLAALRDTDAEIKVKPKKQRTHWDMLMERRCEDELRETLNQQIDILVSGVLA
ncbi:MAG: RNA polymerase-binding protein RbpA [Bifidobacteriaceae bacterium]|jgi:hypothetical protein|nr:RNA polymerase-binding protein RbpA [Bifidobacteriaceae bacterium]